MFETIPEPDSWCDLGNQATCTCTYGVWWREQQRQREVAAEETRGLANVSQAQEQDARQTEKHSVQEHLEDIIRMQETGEESFLVNPNEPPSAERMEAWRRYRNLICTNA